MQVKLPDETLGCVIILLSAALMLAVLGALSARGLELCWENVPLEDQMNEAPVGATGVVTVVEFSTNLTNWIEYGRVAYSTQACLTIANRYEREFFRAKNEYLYE